MFRTMALLAAMAAGVAAATPADDEKTVAQLDRDYQLAVKNNDAATIKRIHADDMILVTGRGKVFRGSEIEERARKGTDPERGAFDYKVWFSDTYVRLDGRWRYAFGQASIPLPKEN